MAIRHREIRTSRGFTDDASSRSRSTLAWWVWGANNDVAAMKAYLSAQSVVPDTYDGLSRKQLAGEWVEDTSDVWEFEAEYVEPEKVVARIEPGSYLFNFDTTGGQILMTTSRETTSYPQSAPSPPTPPVTFPPPDFKNAVNVTGTGPQARVNGAQVVIPTLNFSLRVRQPQATVDLAYAKTLARLTGTTNSTPQFDGQFEPGELLFRGATGGEGNESDPEIIYHYAASQNVTGLTIGDIADIAKKGHEYLWVLFEPVEDPTSKWVPQIPKAVYVERMYEQDDWANMALPL